MKVVTNGPNFLCGKSYCYLHHDISSVKLCDSFWTASYVLVLWEKLHQQFPLICQYDGLGNCCLLHTLILTWKGTVIKGSMVSLTSIINLLHLFLQDEKDRNS